MYEIEYKFKAQNIIKKFIESYKNTFLEIFSDTGIYNEIISKKIREVYDIEFHN